MFHLAKIREENVLVEKAAALGEARAMGAVCSVLSSDESIFQLARAEAWLWHCFRNGTGCEKNLDFVEDLLERAVDLGSFNAYSDLVENCGMEPAHRMKLLMNFLGLYSFGWSELHSDFEAVLESHARDGSFGNLIFEAGEMLKGDVAIKEGPKFFLKAVAMYDGPREKRVLHEFYVPYELAATKMSGK